MAQHDPGLSGLTGSIAILIQELRGLLRVEIALAKAEMSQGAARMAVGISLIVLAAMLSFIGLLALSGAAVLAVNAQGYSLLASAIMVGASVILLAAIFAFVGIRKVSVSNLVPKRAMANIRADLKSATEMSSDRPY